MKILFLNGSRGEWGYIKPVIDICISEKIEYGIIATNMLLMREHGMLYEKIIEDGYNVVDCINMSFSEADHYSVTKGMGVLLQGLAETLKREKPDWLILAGDRGEQLIGAIAASYTYTPVAHIQAGERSGNIDGIARHAIGKLVHIHFASNEDAANRLLGLGEQDFRIFNVGAPQLDEIKNGDISEISHINNLLGFDIKSGALLCIMHPVTEEAELASIQTLNLVKALNEFDLKKIWIMPNNDAGGHLVRQVIQENRNSDCLLFDNMRRQDYLGVLKHCSAIVGNSSSGLLEAPSFQTPCVNLGRRQSDRVTGQNVLQGGFEINEIISLVKIALSDEFNANLVGSINPYGDGQSAGRIVEILRSTNLEQSLLVKSLTF